MNSSIEIKESKKKLSWISLGALLLVLLSVFILYKADLQTKWNPLLLKVIAIIGIAFFGYALIVGIKKLLGKEKIRLVIDDKRIYLEPQDITYNIAKKDIIRISEASVFSNKFILIFVENKDDYIQKENKKLRKQMMKTNVHQYGTPFVLSTSTLQISHNRLKNILEEISKENNL